MILSENQSYAARDKCRENIHLKPGPKDVSEKFVSPSTECVEKITSRLDHDVE